MKVEVWKCDSCGKLMEKPGDVYTVTFKSLPYSVYDGHRWEEQVDKIVLHFCERCVRGFKNVIQDIIKEKGLIV
jgi:hypothetical protein